MRTIDRIIEHIPCDIFADHTLRQVLKGSPDSRYGRVKTAFIRGDLIHVRRGLYALGKRYQRHPVNLYELAQLIYGPSYVSFESALFYHGWIPEAVYAITSACTKRNKEFQTSFGLFSYLHVPAPLLFLGVDRIESPEGTFFMASPWKALVDMIYGYKKNWLGLDPVMKSLRVEPENFKNCDAQLLDALKALYQRARVSQFIDSVKKELKA